MSDDAWVLNEDEALELLALLITSARILLDEPAIYGPLRLLTTTDRLSGFIQDRVSPEVAPVIKKMVENIPEMHMRMSEDEWYRAHLDTLCRDIATVLVAKSEAQS